MAKLNSIDDFLNHRGGGGSGSSFLKSWKKSPGTIDVFLHTKRIPQPLWSHQWHKIEARTDKDTRRTSKEVWMDKFVCHEPEEVLKQFYKRTEDDEREIPPTHCGFCRFIEHVRRLVKAGKLDWKEPIFRFIGDGDADRNVTIHAAGIYGGYSKVEKGDDEYVELKNAGIFINKVWNERAEAKMSYVLCVVNANNPTDGVQIATEPQLLGQKLQRVIKDQRESLGDKGNPFLHPYAFRWKALPEEKKFDDKYAVVPMPRTPLTTHIAKLISSSPPDISNLLKPGDHTSLRAKLEEHALPALKKAMRPKDWDAIFDVEAVEEEEDDAASFNTPEYDAAETAAQVRKPADADDELTCDDCGAAMGPKDAKCPECGAEYDVTDDEAQEEEPAEVTTPAKRIPPATPAVRVPPKNPPSAAADDDEGDDLPFDKPQPARRAKR